MRSTSRRCRIGTGPRPPQRRGRSPSMTPIGSALRMKARAQLAVGTTPGMISGTTNRSVPAPRAAESRLRSGPSGLMARSRPGRCSRSPPRLPRFPRRQPRFPRRLPRFPRRQHCQARRRPHVPCRRRPSHAHRTPPRPPGPRRRSSPRRPRAAPRPRPRAGRDELLSARPPGQRAPTGPLNRSPARWPETAPPWLGGGGGYWPGRLMRRWSWR